MSRLHFTDSANLNLSDIDCSESASRSIDSHISIALTSFESSPSLTFATMVKVEGPDGNFTCQIVFAEDRIRFVDQNDPKRTVYWYLWDQVKSLLFYHETLRVKVNHMNQRKVLFCKFASKQEAKELESNAERYEFIKKSPRVGKLDKLKHHKARRYDCDHEVHWPNKRESDFRADIQHCSSPVRPPANIIDGKHLDTSSKQENKSPKSIVFSPVEHSNDCPNASGNLAQSKSFSEAKVDINPPPTTSVYHTYFDNKPLDKDKLNEIDIYNIALLGMLQFDYANKEQYQQILKVKLEEGFPSQEYVTQGESGAKEERPENDG